jgi:hypothetical protein
VSSSMPVEVKLKTWVRSAEVTGTPETTPDECCDNLGNRLWLRFFREDLNLCGRSGRRLLPPAQRVEHVHNHP